MLPSAKQRAKLKLVQHKIYPKTGTLLLSYEVR
jgi:hypothetical protein